MVIEPDSKRMFVKVQYVSNGGTRVFCSFIAAGESVITLEIAGAAGNPKRGHRWYDRVKYLVGCVIKNWRLLVFVCGIFFEMLLQV